MAEAPTLLKVLLTERHMQPHPVFCREYEKAARRIDPALVATAPDREQYQRRLSSRVKTKPHPHHCRVLERMFPGRTVMELFSSYSPPEQDETPIGKKDFTKRRRLFELGGAAMASVLFDRLWTEPARMHEALDTATVSQARLADLQGEAASLGVRVVRVPPTTPGIFSFLPEKLTFREARGLVELGLTEQALAAAERALTLYDFNETTEPALVRFGQASALAQAGEIQEACRVAATAVLDQHTYHGVTVVTRAKEFDLLLGPSNRGAVHDWRELLASVRSPQLTLAAAVEESV